MGLNEEGFFTTVDGVMIAAMYVSFSVLKTKQVLNDEQTFRIP